MMDWVYLAGFPLSLMRIVAGHDKKKGNFFLRHADVEPLPALS